jgi:hypothetical protein
VTRAQVSVGRLASVSLVIGGLSTILWLLWDRTGRLVPEPPWLAAALVGLLIVVVLWVAWPVRATARGTATRHLDPLRAARAVVFAQAGALTGAALAGWYAGQLAVVAANLDLVAYHGRLWRIALLVVGSGLLAAAGLVAQSWCRVNRPKDEDHDGPTDDNGRRPVS